MLGALGALVCAATGVFHTGDIDPGNGRLKKRSLVKASKGFSRYLMSDMQ